MSALDLRPRADSAAASRRAISHGLTEAKLLVRNGEQLLLALVIPIGILVLGRIIGGRFGDLAVLTPSVLALAVWSSAFTSTAISTGFERRYGVLERLAATPLRKTGLLAGKALAIGLVTLGQLIVLGLVGLALGWRPSIHLLPTMITIVMTIVAAAAFCCLALILAGTLRAEITLALANLIYLIFAAGGGLIIPVARYPEALQPIISLLPTAALGEALRSWSAGTMALLPLAVLLVWLVLAVLTARKVFRWTS